LITILCISTLQSHHSALGCKYCCNSWRWQSTYT